MMGQWDSLWSDTVDQAADCKRKLLHIKTPFLHNATREVNVLQVFYVCFNFQQNDFRIGKEQHRSAVSQVKKECSMPGNV